MRNLSESCIDLLKGMNKRFHKKRPPLLEVVECVFVCVSFMTSQVNTSGFEVSLLNE